MKFVILFEDAPDADPNIRRDHMASHLAFLESHAGTVEAAGPLTDAAGGGRDGLWIVEAESEEAVERLVRADPFWPTGLRQSYAILPWRQVFAAGQRLVTLS